MDRPGLDLGCIDAHCHKDSLDRTQSALGLILPPFMGFIDILVQGLRLDLRQFQSFEAFLIGSL